MAMSGVKTNDDVVTSFEEMKLRHTIKYMILKIENDKEIIVEKKKMQCDCPNYDETYEEFKCELKDEPRYALYDYELVQPPEQCQQTDAKGTKSDKLLLVSWNPDESKVKPRMLYASTKNGLKDKLKGVHADMTISDKQELDAKNVESILGKK